MSNQRGVLIFDPDEQTPITSTEVGLKQGLDVILLGVSPTDSSQSNPSYVLTRNGSGYITSIVMTIGATTYTKTVIRDGSNYITSISKWV